MVIQKANLCFMSVQYHRCSSSSSLHLLICHGSPLPVLHRSSGEEKETLGDSVQVPPPVLQSHSVWSSGCTWNTPPSHPLTLAPPQSPPAGVRLGCCLPLLRLFDPEVLPGYVAQRGTGGGSHPTSPLRLRYACTWRWANLVYRGLPGGRWPTGQNYERKQETVRRQVYV